VAKLKTPMLGLGASGTLADALTFQRRPGTSYVRKKPIPTDTRSPAQLAQRQKYRDAVTAWHALTAEEKAAWRGQCPGLTAYQCFISSELKYVPAPPPPEEYTEDQTANTHGMYVCAPYPRSGQRLTIANRKVTKLAFLLLKSGSPPAGDVTFTIRRVSDGSVILSKVWGSAPDLPTVKTWEEVEFDTPTLVNQEVRICVEYSLGTTINCVLARFAASDVKSNEYRCYYFMDAWEERTDQDLTYRYKYHLP